MISKLAALKKPLLFALLSGLLLALSCAGPLGWGPAAWIALIPLMYACTITNPRQAAVIGFICGLVYFTVMLYWVVIVMTTYGHLPWWLSVLIMLLLACYMSIYPALFSAGFNWMASLISPLWFAPLLWVSLDFIRSKLFTGFPWHDLAYTQYRFPLLIQTADLTGHYGITFLIVLFNTLFFTLIKLLIDKKRLKDRFLQLDAIVAFILLGSALLYSIVRSHTITAAMKERNIPAIVVQGNVAQDQKWVPGSLRKTVDTYVRLSQKALAEQPLSIMIWPETALPLYPLESDIFPYLVKQLNITGNAALLTGAPHRENSPNKEAVAYYNSAFLVAANEANTNNTDNVQGRYDKQHLVPFGEYIPLKEFLPLSGPLVETIGDFTVGKKQPPLTWKGIRMGVLICYESIFPELTSDAVSNGANLLVNITNDAWFGRSSAPWQHLSMAVFRAVETRRSLARAANTGISGFIDPRGDLHQLAPLFETCFRRAELPIMEIKTCYLLVGRFFALLCTFCMAAIIFFYWRNRKS